MAIRVFQPHRRRNHGAPLAATLTLAAAVALNLPGPSLRAAEIAPARTPGLILTVRSAQAAETDAPVAPQVTPNVWLYVKEGQSPTPFLSPGKFTATWEGAIHAALRGRFRFQAELNGTVQVEIKRAVALESSGAGTATPLSKRIRLNKGPNPLKVTFTSPETGDAFVRLAWAAKSEFTSPIPNTTFTHLPKPGLEHGRELRRGRELFLDLRCLRCHTDPDPNLAAHGPPELQMDAPSFQGIGTRREHAWMTSWILNPKQLRPSAHMPRLLAEPAAREEAEAIAAFLATLKAPPKTVPAKPPYQTRQDHTENDGPAAHSSHPAPLHERLHCAGCHNLPATTNSDAAKISLKAVARKFPPGQLAQFLLAPEAHYAWTRMPDFHLTPGEARELERWLIAGAATAARTDQSSIDSDLVRKGIQLIQTRHCLRCHDLGPEVNLPGLSEDNASELKLPPTLRSLKPPAGRQSPGSPRSCLGDNPTVDYQLNPEDRRALALFLNHGRPSLARHVPAEFADRQLRQLNCAACHGHIDLVSPADLLGGKLKPEWTARFIGGEIPHKIRYDAHPMGEPWLPARMPAFKSRAVWLAQGMAALNGYGPVSPPESPVDPALARVGHKLVGKNGGFSCISCHAVASQEAIEVFESEGINFLYSADRLRPAFYRRWMRAPTSIDPQTQMPVYFEDNFSPLTEILDGNPEAQISAIWEYLKLRAAMPPPETQVE